MNILFLIGNGFDLNIGLKTSFKDVLKVYLNTSSDRPNINKFKEEIKGDTKLEFWSDFEKQFGVYAEKFSLENVDEYHECLKDFRRVLISHLKHEESRINYDLYKDEIVSLFKKSIVSFYSTLEDGSKYIISAIIASQNNTIIYNFITFNYTNVLEKCLNLVKPNILTRQVSQSNIPTRTYQDSITKPLYIHGTTEKFPIIGVDNEKQIHNNELLQNELFKKKIIKPIVNDSLRNLNNKNARDIIGKSHVIIIFGMALGETDSTWWIQIVQWLKKDSNHHLVVFIYDPSFTLLDIDDRIAHEQNIILKLFTISGIKQEVEQYRQQIHISINSEIFKIDLTKE